PILDMSGNLRVALGPYPVPPPPDVSGQSFAYPPTFYPGTPSVTAATVLDVGSGSDVVANVQLRALSAGILRGVVEGPGQVANLLVRLLSDPALGVGLETATARTDAAGAFAFANVPAGDYVIEVPVSLNEYEYHAPGGPPFAQRAPQAFGTMNTRSWAAQGARPGTAIVSRSS